MNTQVYVAGRMRGVPCYGFPKFDKAVMRLLALGLKPVSPADLDRQNGFDPTGGVAEWKDWSVLPDTFDVSAAIARDNEVIDDPETVAIYIIHKGIAESSGGMAEIERGMSKGKILVYDTMSDDEILRALGLAKGTLKDAASAEADTLAVSTQRWGERRENSTEEIRYTDPKTGGMKGDKLARHDLLPPDIVHELAEHYGKGARKYGERNMEKGYPWSKTYAACHRHLNAFWRGEDFDEETGSLHLVSAAWHCFTMAWFFRHNAGTDDRPKGGTK